MVRRICSQSMRLVVAVAGLLAALFVSSGFVSVPEAHALGVDDFVTTWDTTNPGTSDASSITIPILGSGYAYRVDWNGDGDFDDADEATVHSGAVTHSFPAPGIYQIRITGDFPQINFNNSGDAQKITSIDQWGAQTWVSMENSFFGCSNLTITATDAPDLTIVTSLASMFRGVPSTPNLTAWNTSTITNMRSVFRASGANPDVSAWDMSSVNDMDSMFRDATNATPDVSNWDTSTLVNAYGLFTDAVAANPDVSNWDTVNVTAMGYMFRGATSANPEVSGWDTSSVLDMQSLFRGATSATPDVSEWDTGSVTSMYSMFRGATSANPEVSGWDTSNVTTMQGMFFDASIATPDVSEWDTSSVTTMQSMFRAAALADPDVSGWDTSSVTSMYSLYYDAVGANPDVSGWDTSSVTLMSYMFQGASLATPDVSGWDTSGVTSMTNMFRGATSANPDTSSWNTSLVAEMDNMFRDATSSDPDVSGWNTSLVTSLQSMFFGAASANPDVSSWDTSSVTEMDYTFRGAAMADPDVSGWDTSSVTTMEGMFLDSLAFDRALDSWDLTAVTDLTNFMSGASMSSENYDATLQAWAAQSLQSNLNVDFGASPYCGSATERATIEGTFNWTITDGGVACAPATPTMAADLPAASDSGSSETDNVTSVAEVSLTIPCSAEGRTIRVFADLPVPNTVLTSAPCPDSLQLEVNLASLTDGIYQLTYTESDGSAESDHSPALQIHIDSAAPAAPACTAAPEIAGLGTSVLLVCSGVESGATLVVPNMVCLATEGGEPGHVVCEGTVGSNSAEDAGRVMTSNDTVVMTDAAGNRLEFLSGLVVDVTPPVATLLGATAISLPVGGTFADPGASCIDVESAACTIERSGSIVDTTTAGTYIVSYMAVDGAGNISLTVTREVIVYIPTTPKKVPSAPIGRVAAKPSEQIAVESPRPELAELAELAEPAASVEPLPAEDEVSPPAALSPPAEESAPNSDPIDLVADAAFIDESNRSNQWFSGVKLLGVMLVLVALAWFALVGRRRNHEEDPRAV